MKQIASLPQGSFRLERYPDTGNPTLQAWDAADELLLAELAADPPAEGSRILIVNDGFGALGCALHRWKPDYHHDSLLAETALHRNLQRNGIPATAVPRIELEGAPARTGSYDLLLVKMPKQLAYLEYLLLQLRQRMQPTSRLLLAGMTRHLPRAAYELCAALFDRAESSRAVKKARTISCSTIQGDPAPASPTPPAPAALELAILETWNGISLVKLPNTFARRHIDVGSRLLADCLLQGHGSDAPTGSSPGRRGPGHGAQPMQILDIGCGSGFLSAAAALACPDALITGIDESRLAVRSAAESLRRTAADHPGIQSLQQAAFAVMDGGCLALDPGFNLIICNPPFHEQGAVNRRLARRLLEEAARVLAPRGRILLVANSSLGYQGMLGDLFTRITEITREAGFSVMRLQTGR